jgi:hypothetical protein
MIFNDNTMVILDKYHHAEGLEEPRHRLKYIEEIQKLEDDRMFEIINKLCESDIG